MLVDVTVCPIRRPQSQAIQRLFYSGKHKDHVIKWECAVSIRSGKFVWFSDFFPGKVHDIKILKSSGLLEELVVNEKLMGDKAYVGLNAVITPFRGRNLNQQQEEHNQLVNQKRVLIERSFGRLKNFKCLKDDWRNSFSKHKMAFIVCVHLTNLLITESPL